MFSMTIIFGNACVPFTLLFKNPATFDSKDFDITDDYGQHACVRREIIQGVMFEDLTKSKLAQIERGMHQMRTQVEANNMAKADPALMAAMRMQQQAPGVITPFGPNGAFRQ